MRRIIAAIAILQFASLTAQPLGETFLAGTTIPDILSEESVGRMIAVDFQGWVNIVWTSDDSEPPRQCIWNLWRPDSSRFVWPDGVPSNSLFRSGYPQVLALSDGNSFIASNGLINDIYNLPHSCVTFAPHMNAFTCVTPELQEMNPVVYPRMAQTRDYIHLIARYRPNVDSIGSLVYLRGTVVRDDSAHPLDVNWEGITLLDEVSSVGHAIAAQQGRDRVAVAWHAHCPDTDNDLSNDVYIRKSNDNGSTWDPPLNITSFAIADTGCLDMDTMVCNRDTMRAYSDISLVYDLNGILHCVFKTVSWYTITEIGRPFSYINLSHIWHWDADSRTYSLIANGWWPINMNDGSNQFNVQRPSLAQDTLTGFLYCAYMKYDTSCYSNQGFTMADVWISVSTNGGRNWSLGTNVTQTCPGQSVPAPGSISERDPSLDEFVSNGLLHLTYLTDYDAGSAAHSEGTWTENDMLYQRIPVDSIPTTPLIENYPLHWDSSGFYATADDPRVPVPNAITLSAYPNPFNSTTNIEYTLSQRAPITISIYDILGREVATLFNGTKNPGPHKLTWNANTSSGIYFVTLRAANKTQTQKLLLLK